MEAGFQAARSRSDDPGDAFNSDCPGRVVLNHLTSRWGLLILVALLDGPMRFSALGQLVDGISEKMLSQTLRMLTRDGLLVRHVRPTVPPSVSYELTPLGRSGAEPLREMLRWVKGNALAVFAAQEEYDASSSLRA